MADLRLSPVNRIAAEVRLLAPDGDIAELPSDLLAVLGLAWARLAHRGEGWQRTPAEPPSRFHEQHAVRRRVLKLLLRLVALSGGEARVWLPQRVQMGDMLGFTFETCSRVLRQRRREGLVGVLPPQPFRLNMGRAVAALATLDGAHTH